VQHYFNNSSGRSNDSRSRLAPDCSGLESCGRVALAGATRKNIRPIGLWEASEKETSKKRSYLSEIPESERGRFPEAVRKTCLPANETGNEYGRES
jgi:hypothetical protein